MFNSSLKNQQYVYEIMVHVFVEIVISLKNYTSTNINMKWGNSSYTQNKKLLTLGLGLHLQTSRDRD